MRNMLLGLLLFIVLIISGCGKVELQNAAIPLSVGADLEDHKIALAINVANPVSPEKATSGEPQFTVLTSTGQTFSEAIRNASLSFSNYPLWSHLELSIVGEKLARTDMSLVMDFIVRNRYVRKNLLVVVAHNATPEEILSVKPLLEPHPPTAIKHLLQIQESQLGIYTPIEYTELLHQFSSPGIDPVLPMITIDKSGPAEKHKLDGMAVFKGKKMVGILDESESRGFRLMRSGMIQGGLFLVPSPVNQENWVTLELSRSQSKITPQYQGNQIKMKIDINAEGNFYEQSGSDDLFSPEMFKQLEKIAEKELEQQMTSSILKAQGLNSDIFGWGQMIYRDNPKLWKRLAPEWDQIFPAVQSEFNVTFSLRRSYLTDKAFVFRE